MLCLCIERIFDQFENCDFVICDEFAAQDSLKPGFHVEVQLSLLRSFSQANPHPFDTSCLFFGSKKSPKLFAQGPHILEFAFPNDQRSPAEQLQGALVTDIPFPVTGKLLVPVSGSGFGAICDFAAIVAMPKAAMDKDNFLSRAENEVR